MLYNNYIYIYTNDSNALSSMSSVLPSHLPLNLTMPKRMMMYSKMHFIYFVDKCTSNNLL